MPETKTCPQTKINHTQKQKSNKIIPKNQNQSYPKTKLKTNHTHKLICTLGEEFA